MGMSQTGCCCGTKVGNCTTCEPTAPICCLQVEHTGWVANAPILLRPAATALWDTADTCTGINATEICGIMQDHWNLSSADRFCMPRITLQWKPIESDCDRIALTLTITWKGLTAHTTIEENRSWPSRDIEFDDPIYPLLVSTYPELYDAADYVIKIRVCPEGYTPFPLEDKVVTLQAVLQENGEDWTIEEEYPGGEATTLYSYVTAQGSCVCGGRCSTFRGDPGYIFQWAYDPYKDQVLVALTLRWDDWPAYLGCAESGSTYLGYDSCGWADTEFSVPLLGGCKPESTFTARVSKVDECYKTGDPVDPPKYCHKASLCVMLSVPDEGETNYAAAPVTLFYDLVWNEDTQQYELAPTAVPGSKPYTIEITLVEDAGSLPTGSPAGSRAWILAVSIKEVPSGTVVLEYTDVLVLDCTEAWSWEDVLEVPIDPTEDWLLHIGTSCPTAPEPPECDPGCWPDCVLCPTPLSMSLVVSQNPECCLHGSYGLTYDATNNWFYLASPVGGPEGVCGKILEFKMSCASSSTVTCYIKYRDITGTDRDETFTVSASCSGGGFETANHEIPSGLFLAGLCEGGFGKGANVRVVGA